MIALTDLLGRLGEPKVILLLGLAELYRALGASRLTSPHVATQRRGP